MKKSLYSVILSALLIVSLLAGCYSDKADVVPPTEAQTQAAEKRIETTETKPTEKAQEPVTEAKSAEIKEEKATEAKRNNTAETKPAEAKRISGDEAKNKAIARSGVSKDKIRDFEIELEKERGVTLYEISFDAEGREYEYAIEAYTGEILWSHSERDR